MDRVLIVDDQPSFCRQLRQLLEYAGWAVVDEAGDIVEAEKIVINAYPDLAIVDVFLPGVNGIEGARRLKSLCPKLRVILVSAYGDRVEIIRQAALAAGAEALLSKDDLDLDWARGQKKSV